MDPEVLRVGESKPEVEINDQEEHVRAALRKVRNGLIILRKNKAKS